MAEYKTEVSFAVTLALVGVLVMAAATVYLFPAGSIGGADSPPKGGGLQNHPGGLGTTTTTTPDPYGGVTVTSTTTATTQSFMFTTTLSGSCDYSGNCNSTSSTTTVGPADWNAFQVANITLNSPEIQSYIKTAYSYNIAFGASASNPSLVDVVINVTGSQVVAGNWTTGYVVSYTGIRTLNTTVQFTAPSTYRMGVVNATSFPDQNETIAFTSQQQQVIKVALSNDTVRNNMTGYDLKHYFVESVTSFPVGNGTYGGDYFVVISQVNGPRTMNAFVNAGIAAVLEVYGNSMTAQTCYYPPGTCFNSPWNPNP